jgi:uncharacterized membrane protein
MDKLIAAVFDTETKAYQGAKALTELDAQGCISLYALGVVTKEPSGKLSVKQEPDQGPLGTAVGLLTGTAIGLLGGPIGAAVGAYVGTVGGLAYDVASVGLSDEFIADVGKHLQPGKTALIAEVEEEWVLPLDTAMEHAGGVVFRQGIAEFRSSLIDRDIAGLKSEIAELRAEQEKAVGDAKIKLQAKIDAAKAKLQATQERAKADIEATNKRREAKLQSLRESAAKAKGDAKAKIDARIAAVQVDYKHRSEKLKQAWELTKQALAV